MPHKVDVIKYLDEIDPIAEEIGAINTIVNNKGHLKGYNTDYLGAKQAIQEKYDVKGKSVLLIGAGGVSRAIITALKALNPNSIAITNRSAQKAKDLSEACGTDHLAYSKIRDYTGDLLINATSVGMMTDNEMIVDEKTIGNFEAVMDTVNNPLETYLIKKSKEKHRIVIPGYLMPLYQAAEQFKLYVGAEAPINIMLKNIKELIN